MSTSCDGVSATSLSAMCAWIDGEDQVEARDLLLDQAPLVDATRPLEQERLGVDRDEDVLRVGTDVGLERERPLRPGEEEVDRLLDLVLDVLVQLLAGEEALRDEDLAQLSIRRLPLQRDGGVEFGAGDQPVLHQQVAEPVAPVDDRREGDPPAVKIDVAERVPVRDAQAAALLPHGQQLQHVGERGLAQRSTDGHQRNSSMTRPSMLGQSDTIFSASKKNESSGAVVRASASKSTCSRMETGVNAASMTASIVGAAASSPSGTGRVASPAIAPRDHPQLGDQPFLEARAQARLQPGQLRRAGDPT